MLLFWPLTVVAGFVYPAVWGKLGLPRFVKPIETPFWTEDLRVEFISFLILTMLAVLIANALLRLSSHKRKLPKSDFLNFVGCWIVTVLILFNPNTFNTVVSILSKFLMKP